MALTLPANYEKALDLKNINENWIFHLYYGDETNFTAVSMFDTTIDGCFWVCPLQGCRASIDYCYF